MILSKTSFCCLVFVLSKVIPPAPEGIPVHIKQFLMKKVPQSETNQKSGGKLPGHQAWWGFQTTDLNRSGILIMGFS